MSKRGNQKWKRVVASVLAGLMLIGAAGCGKKNKDDGGGDGSLKNAGSAKENVYTYEDIPGELGGGPASNCDIKSMKWVDDKLHIVAVVSEYGEVMKQELVIRDCDLKGENLSERKIDLSGEKTETQMISKWLGTVALAADGRILGQVEENITTNPDSESPEYANASKMYCWASDDTLAWEKELSMFSDGGDGFYISGIYAAAESDWYVLGAMGEDTFIYRVSAEGEITDKKPLKKPEGMMSLGMSYPKEDGKLLLVGDSSDWVGQVMATYDPETGMVGETTSDEGVFSKYNIIGYDSDDSFFLSTGNGIFTGKPGQAEVTPLMDYVNSDFAYGWMSAAVKISEDQFVGAYTDDQGKTHLSLFTHVAPENVADKQVLTLGANDIGSELRKRIIDFNKENMNYRITIKDYSAYITDDDYEAGSKQLANDIVAGKMPDILVVDSTTSVADYAAKGLLASVDDLIGKDPELSKVEFMDNVFEAYRIKGKLYQLIPYFSVGTVLAKESVAEGHQGWTMDEMLEVVKTMGDDVQAFDNVSRESFFDLVMRYSGTDFVDVSSGKCNFNTPQFIQLLEFAATLRKTDARNEEEIDWTEIENRFRDNKVLLNAISLYSVRSINRIEQADFGEKAAFVGFPSSNGTGSAINIEESYLISSKSKNIDGAWEFLRTYLMEDFQKKEDFGMPVRKDVFLEKANEATRKPYYSDETGKRIEYDETIYVHDQEIKIAPMSQGRVDEVVAFIEGVKYAGYTNRAVLDIINEEAAGFFENQKSAQDVAAIIQSRVQIYVDERR